MCNRQDNEEDIFEYALSLEDQYYQEGYDLGVADGSKAGRIEGRVFGMEKGFEKFLMAGRLHGRAAVWAARLPRPGNSKPVPTQSTPPSYENRKSSSGAQHDGGDAQGLYLPPIPGNASLERNIQALYAWTEPGTLPTQNTEEDVAEVDHRIKRSEAKAKVIEKNTGEVDLDREGQSQESDATIGRPKRPNSRRLERNMEDFEI